MEDSQDPMALQNLMLLMLAAAGGALAAVFVAPAWVPGLAGSLAGETPHAFWYLSRASALVASGLLWLATAMGVSITNQLAKLWPGGPTAFDVHQHASLLGLAFALFHGLILLGDRYAGYQLWQLLIPFAGGDYRPVWVGLGQVAFYLTGVVALSWYVRPKIGRTGWRTLHYLSFAAFLLALAHGIWSGSDSAAPLVQALYWLAGGSVLFLTTYRALHTRVP